MTDKEKADISMRLVEFLPDAIEVAITQYHKFAEVDECAKTYREAQAACKVAVTHMAGLLALAQRVQGQGEGESAEKLEDIMARAREELAAYEEKLEG